MRCSYLFTQGDNTPSLYEQYIKLLSEYATFYPIETDAC